jgi:hypothetical protein
VAPQIEWYEFHRVSEDSLNKIRGALVASLAIAAMGGGAIIGSAPASSAAPIGVLGTCGNTFSPVTSGAKAHWEVQCNATQVRIAGWVEDTAADGQCAKVKAIYPDGFTFFSPAACPKGNRDNFTSPWRSGRSVNGYLYEYDV